MKIYFWAKITIFLSIWILVSVVYGQDTLLPESKLVSIQEMEPVNLLDQKTSIESRPTTNIVDERISRLEKQQTLLEEILKSQKDIERQRLDSIPVVKAGKDGFWIKSPDNAYSLRLGGYVHADGRFVSGQDSDTSNDTFLLRRVRPIFDGTVAQDFVFRIMPDFGEGKASLQDAYIEWKHFSQAKFRVGKFKEPFGIERLQSATDLRFVERALPTNLVPNRDIGVMLHGEFWKSIVSYQVGIFNGVADGGSIDRDDNEGKDLAGRLFIHPFKNSRTEIFQGLGVGGAVTYGVQDGSGVLGSYKTAGQETFFKYRSGVLAGEGHTRISPQAYYYYKSFGLLGEWVQSSQDIMRNEQIDRIDNTGWQVQASYLLTGEKASYKGVSPIHPFDFKKGGYGAWEVVGRYSQLDVDSGAFPVYADRAASAESAKAFGVGLNWYLNSNIKAMLDYERTGFVGGSITGDRKDESAIFLRVQVSF